MRVILTAKSGTNPEEPYYVTFSVKDGKLTVFCDCQAGIHRNICKHKIGLSMLEASWLHDSSQFEQLNKAHSLVLQSELSNLLPEYIEIMRQRDEINKSFKRIKKKVADAMKDGC